MYCWQKHQFADVGKLMSFTSKCVILHPMIPHRNRSAGIVLKDDKVLLMHRFNNGDEYWVFPGGGQEPGETNDQTTVREVAEETSLVVEARQLLYRIDWDTGDRNYFYLCEYLSGEPSLPIDSPEYQEANDPNAKDGPQVFDPCWVPVADMPSLIVYPLEVRDVFLADYAATKGFAEQVPETKSFAIVVAERRQG